MCPEGGVLKFEISPLTQKSLKLVSVWGDALTRTQIVVIGPKGVINEQNLNSLFASCIASNDTVEENRLADAVVEILRRP